MEYQKKYYYEITGKGFDLLPVLMELSQWGEKYIDGTWAPEEIRGLYKHDRKAFRREWKKNVRARSKEYLKSAISGATAR